MVTCSPRNATLVWPQHTAAESQLHHANEGTDSVVKGRRARKRKEEGRREGEWFIRKTWALPADDCLVHIHMHTHTHTHCKSAPCVSGVCSACLHMLLCQQRWWRGGGFWKERENILGLVCFVFLAFVMLGCVLPLFSPCPWTAHERTQRDPETDCEQGHNHCRLCCSGINMQTGKLPPPPSYSTSGQIELLAFESATGLEITCLICKPQWMQTEAAAHYNQEKHMSLRIQMDIMRGGFCF